MKNYSLKELQELAQPVFAEHPHEEYLWATTDGQVFLSSKEDAANLHCQSAGVSKFKVQRIKAFENKLEDELIENAEEIADDLKSMSPENLERYQGCDYRERAHWIGECESVEEVEFYMQDESSKTVIAAAEKRIEELTA